MSNNFRNFSMAPTLTFDASQVASMPTLDECTTINVDAAYVRAVSKRYIESLLADGRYELAITMAHRISRDYGTLVATAALRNIVERNLEPATSSGKGAVHLPVTPENLFASIYAANDTNTLYYLTRGARINWRDEHWRRAALSMFGSNVMQRSINFLLDNELVPPTLGLEYLHASVNSINCRLSVCLANMPRVIAEFNALDEQQQQSLNALYLYWKCRNLAEIARDMQRLVTLERIFSLGSLLDDEFIRFVRLSDLFKCCTDDHVLYIRDHVLLRRAGGATTGNRAAAPVAGNPTGGMLAEIVDLVDRYPSFTPYFVEEMRQRLSIETTTTFILPTAAAAATSNAVSPFNLVRTPAASAALAAKAC